MRTTETYSNRDQLTATSGSPGNSFGYFGEGQNTRTTADGTSFTSTMLGLSSQTAGSSTTEYIRTLEGTLVAEATPGSSTLYPLTDGQNSVLALETSGSTTAAGYSYDPYGLTHTSTGSAAAAHSVRYAGGYTDIGSDGIHGTASAGFGPEVGVDLSGTYNTGDAEDGCEAEVESTFG